MPDQAAAVMQASDAKKSEQAGNDIFGEAISPEDARPRSVMGGVRKPPGGVGHDARHTGQCNCGVPCWACGKKHAEPCQVVSWGMRRVRMPFGMLSVCTVTSAQIHKKHCGQK